MLNIKGKKRNKFLPSGFTLIELMVVIVIISITTAIGFISYTPKNKVSKTEASAQKMKWMIEQGIKHAILNQKSVGIRYNSKGFYLSEYTPPPHVDLFVGDDKNTVPVIGNGTIILADSKNWKQFGSEFDLGIKQPIDTIFPPLNWRMTSAIHDEGIDNENSMPVIIIFPSGFIYPASSVDFLPQEQGDSRIVLTWTTDGNVTVEKPHE